MFHVWVLLCPVRGEREELVLDAVQVLARNAEILPVEQVRISFGSRDVVDVLAFEPVLIPMRVATTDDSGFVHDVALVDVAERFHEPVWRVESVVIVCDGRGDPAIDVVDCHASWPAELSDASFSVAESASTHHCFSDITGKDGLDDSLAAVDEWHDTPVTLLPEHLCDVVVVFGEHFRRANDGGARELF